MWQGLWLESKTPMRGSGTRDSREARGAHKGPRGAHIGPRGAHKGPREAHDAGGMEEWVSIFMSFKGEIHSTS